MKNIKLTLLALLFISNAHSQLCAHIYEDSIYAKLDGYKHQKDKLDSLQSAYSQEVQKDREAISAKYKALVQSYSPTEQESVDQIKARMNEMDAQKLDLILDENSLLEMRIKSYENLLKQQYDISVKPYINEVNAALEKYAKKNKIDYIWIMEETGKSLAYANKGKNITELITEIVKEQ